MKKDDLTYTPESTSGSMLFVQAEDENEKLEKKVLDCKDLSAEEKLKIIRLIEKDKGITITTTPYIPYKPNEVWYGNYPNTPPDTVYCYANNVRK